MKISIVVPIFNTEKYLRRCVNSLINQDYKEIEVILIDDGSTDTSGEICDEYAMSDSRIKVIHQANGGEAVARNSGIAAASGEYLMFSDSDDEYLPNTARLLIEAMNDDVDLSVGAFLEISNGITRNASTGESPYTRNALINKLLTDNNTYGAGYMMSALQAKLFRASIIREHNLRACPAFVVGNDSIFMMEYLNYCSKIVDTFYPMYIYYKYDVRERQQGMSWHYPDSYRLLIEVTKRRIKILDTDNCLAADKRAQILTDIADELIREIIRAVAFESYFPEGFEKEIEWVSNDEFVQECLSCYKPKRKNDSALIPGYIKNGDTSSTYTEICRKSAEWVNRQQFVSEHLYVRRMYKHESITS